MILSLTFDLTHSIENLIELCIFWIKAEFRSNFVQFIIIVSTAITEDIVNYVAIIFQLIFTRKCSTIILCSNNCHCLCLLSVCQFQNRKTVQTIVLFSIVLYFLSDVSNYIGCFYENLKTTFSPSQCWWFWCCKYWWISLYCSQ